MAKSNLGAYQTMVELAKAADGPVKLGLYVAAGGVLVGGTAVAILGPTIRKRVGGAFIAVKKKIVPSTAFKAKVYTVSAEADGGKGLWLHIGDQFTIENEVEGGALIVVRGNNRNPWMVGTRLLESVSDFAIGDSAL
jgi:hypothetical protein